MNKYAKKNIVSIISALLLSACGGGGGESSSSIAGTTMVKSIESKRDLLFGEKSTIKVDIQTTGKIAAATISSPWRHEINPNVKQHLTITPTKTGLQVENKNNSDEIMDIPIDIVYTNNGQEKTERIQQRLYPREVTANEVIEYSTQKDTHHKITKRLLIPDRTADILPSLKGFNANQPYNFTQILASLPSDFTYKICTEKDKEIQCQKQNKSSGKEKISFLCTLDDSSHPKALKPLQGRKKSEIVFTPQGLQTQNGTATLPEYITNIHAVQQNSTQIINLSSVTNNYHVHYHYHNSNSNPATGIPSSVSTPTPAKTNTAQSTTGEVNPDDQNKPAIQQPPTPAPNIAQIQDPLLDKLIRHTQFGNLKTEGIVDADGRGLNRNARSANFAVPSIQTYSYGQAGDNATSSLSAIELVMRTRVKDTLIYFTVQNKLKNYAQLSNKAYNNTTVKYHALFSKTLIQQDAVLVNGDYKLFDINRKSLNVGNPQKSISVHANNQNVMVWSGPENDPILRQLVAAQNNNDNDVIISQLTDIKSASPTTPADPFIDDNNKGVKKIITVHVLLGKNDTVQYMDGNGRLHETQAQANDAKTGTTSGIKALVSYFLNLKQNIGSILSTDQFTRSAYNNVFDQKFKDGLNEYRRQVLKAHGVLDDQAIKEKIKEWNQQSVTNTQEPNKADAAALAQLALEKIKGMIGQTKGWENNAALDQQILAEAQKEANIGQIIGDKDNKQQLNPLADYITRYYTQLHYQAEHQYEKKEIAKLRTQIKNIYDHVKSQFKQKNIAELSTTSTKVIDCILQQLLQCRGSNANYNEIKTHHNNLNFAQLIDAVLPFINDPSKTVAKHPTNAPQQPCQLNHQTHPPHMPQNKQGEASVKASSKHIEKISQEIVEIVEQINANDNLTKPSSKCNDDAINNFVIAIIDEYTTKIHQEGKQYTVEDIKKMYQPVMELVEHFQSQLEITDMVACSYRALLKEKPQGDNLKAEMIGKIFNRLLLSNKINGGDRLILDGKIYNSDLQSIEKEIQNHLWYLNDPGTIDNPIQKKYQEKSSYAHVNWNSKNCSRLTAIEIINFLTDYKYQDNLLGIVSIENAGKPTYFPQLFRVIEQFNEKKIF